MASNKSVTRQKGLGPLAISGLILGALAISALLIWQGVTAAGTPDPTVAHTSPLVAVLDIAALVFREGLECMLVLTAVTASLRGSNQTYRQPITVGAFLGGLATLGTWFVAMAIVNSLLGSVSALALQAWTGLLAIVVLLVVMNWFFHKVYWTGWITFQNKQKKKALSSSKYYMLWGLGVLGFTSIYREGFEIVLFLQSYRLQLGGSVVFYGAMLGFVLSGTLAVLNFVFNRRLPYKRMLVWTGALLAVVLFIMVGEQMFEFQQASMIGTHEISWLAWVPGWAGTWLSIFPNWETVLAQGVAMVAVVGCYYFSRFRAVLLPKKLGLTSFALREDEPVKEVVGTPMV
jgi:high-affinity iron transporter